MRDDFGAIDWNDEATSLPFVEDQIVLCDAALRSLANALSGLRDLPQYDQDRVCRSLRDLHRQVDDCETEASRII